MDEADFPRQLDQFILTGQLAHTDRYQVFEAHHSQDDTPLRITVLAHHISRDEFLARRLQHVTNRVSQLEHPNILPTYPARYAGDALMVVQQFEPARPLADILAAEGPLPPATAHRLLAQIAAALDCAHQNMLIHGSLAPDQIFVSPQGRVQVAGFGETYALFGPNLHRHPADILCPETAAPERVAGQAPSRPADLYALGIICYHMLAGAPPFTGSAAVVLHGHAHKQPRPLSEVNTAIPPAVSEVVERMLAKGIELRYNTAAEFARALQAAIITRTTYRRYDRLIPIARREQRPFSFKAFIFWAITLFATLMVALLSAWYGYELGLRQRAPTAPPTEWVIHTTLPSPMVRLGRNATPTASPPGPAHPAESISSSGNRLSDSLLPTRRAVMVSTSPTPTPSPTPAAVAPRPTSPPPTAPPPANQAVFSFVNPTGFDLIVDLSGAAATSQLVPPGQAHQFALPPGQYQYMLHTPGGQGLQSVVGTFYLAPGQQVQKDYYSDYDWTRQ